MKKKLMTFLALVLVIAMSVAGTYAYLTSRDSVTNTFTVGNVSITLDELDTDNDANESDNVTVNDKVRDKANAYKLMPGITYTKDPTVHVDPASENCYVFVKVENGIAAYEAEGNTTIAKQIENNGWTKLNGVDGVDNVYYKEYTKDVTDQDLVVFNNFKVSDTANTVDGWSSINTTNTTIVVTAYAVQKDGFETNVAGAWAAAVAAATPTP